MYPRVFEKYILNHFKTVKKNKAVIIYGARQVGKTTLVKKLMQNWQKSAYYSCDYFDVKQSFAYENTHNLANIVKDLDLLILDEAQLIENIGLVIKVLVDNFPKLNIITTGSSSFELANKIKEPLTGRKLEIHLNTLSFTEIYSKLTVLEKKRQIENHLVFGFYPEVVDAALSDKAKILRELTSSYLFKDVFTFQNFKKPELLIKLLQLLAFQIGNEVSFHELAKKLNIDQTVIQRYIHLLEQAFVIYRVGAFANNLRKEISKSRKIYFWDLGVRNALIQNFNNLDLRDDIGALWENFLVSERLKMLNNQQIFNNYYFWRTYDKKEIDYIEKTNKGLFAYEFKYSGKPRKTAAELFLKTYPNTRINVINPDNFLDFIEK